MYVEVYNSPLRYILEENHENETKCETDEARGEEYC